MNLSHRAGLGALAGAALATLAGLLLAVTSAAAPPTLGLVASDTVIGGDIHATAQLAESPGAEGEISFEVFGPGDPTCAGPALTPTPDPATVNGEGDYLSGDFTPTEPGTYRWSAHYTGDLANPAADASCAATSVVDKASPTVSGAATSAPAGTLITDHVTLSGGFAATGQLVFRAYGPGDASCSSSAAYEATVAVSGNGGYSPAGFAPGAGAYRWTVDYSGDDDNDPDSLSCGSANQTSTVSKVSPSLSGSASSATVGTPITDTVTLSGGINATGQLTFQAYGPGDVTCSNPVAYEATVPVNGNGSYAPAGFAPALGQYRWKVSYSGDQSNEADSLACGAANQASTVSKAAPSLSGSAGSAAAGSVVTDTVTLSGGVAAGGQLTFRAYGPGDAGCAGAVEYEATVAVSGNGAYAPPGFSPGTGAYRWTVGYSGDTDNDAASLPCGSPGQTSAVSKAVPGLSGAATAAPAGSAVTDNVTLSGGFAATGQLVFRAYRPGDTSCAEAPSYQAIVAVSGNGPYAPPGFAPTTGLYRWTVAYSGDGNNEAAGLACNAANQASAVGRIDIALGASATDSTVGEPVSATAALAGGAVPAGQITFAAYPPGDVSCTGAPTFSFATAVAGNGTYRSPAFTPDRAGTYRWAVSYSGDPNHAPSTVPCGRAKSEVAQARPSISSSVGNKQTIGLPFQITATLQGGHAPGGAVSFRIYAPGATDCDKPLSVNTVRVTGNGTVRSDPYTPSRVGRYTVAASYSGDADNQGATEPCDLAEAGARVAKRVPRVKPSAILKGKRVAIRAKISGALSPSGALRFRLYSPADKRCNGKPAIGGSVTVKANGTHLLAQYLATKRGTYRLSVNYTGDRRNAAFRGSCAGAQKIKVKR